MILMLMEYRKSLFQALCILTYKHMKRIIRLAFGPWRFMIRKMGQRYQVRYKFNKKHLLADLLMFLGIIFLIVLNLYISFIFTKWVVSLKVNVEVQVSENVR